MYRAIVSEYDDEEAQRTVEGDLEDIFADVDPDVLQVLSPLAVKNALFEVAMTWTVGADANE